MPTIKNKDVVGIIAAINLLQRGRPRGADVEDREPPAKLAPMTSVKLARVKRVVHPAYEDIQEVRKQVIEKYAVLEDGQVQYRSEGGEARFPDAEAEAACRAELKELMEGELEVAESFRFADFRRKERDPDTHKVAETEELEPDIIDGLFPLLILEK